MSPIKCAVGEKKLSTHVTDNGEVECWHSLMKRAEPAGSASGLFACDGKQCQGMRALPSREPVCLRLDKVGVVLDGADYCATG